MRDMLKNYVYPVAVVSGGVIGVGFLSLPYITVKVGLIPMLFYFVALTIFMTFINLIFCDIALATPDFKRWPGFVGFYFGPLAQKIMLWILALGSFGALLVYL